MTNHAQSSATFNAPTVPAALPADRTDQPAPVAGLPALFAVLTTPFLWLSPARIGAHLAASGWRLALAAHLVGLALGLGLIVSTTLFAVVPLYGANGYGPPVLTWSEQVREPLAASAIGLSLSVAPGVNPIPAILLLLSLEVVTLLVAIAIAPFAAAGESARRVSGRSLRLVWWSTTLLIPIGVLARCSVVWRPRLGLPPREWHPFDLAAIGLALVWWLIVVLRSVRRYAGPAEGPGWEPRTPRCRACGYTLVGLPFDTACPECGRPVRDSLPGRDSPPARLGSLRGAARTLRRVLFDRTFFADLSIHNADARPAAWTICVVNAVLLGVGLTPALTPWSSPRPAAWLAIVTAVACAALVLQMLAIGLLATVGAALIRRPLRPTAVAVAYAFWSSFPAAAGVTALVAASALVERTIDHFNAPAIKYAATAIPLAIGVTAILWGLIATILNYRRALTRTRFANA